MCLSCDVFIRAVRSEVYALQGLARSEFLLFNAVPYCHLAPMSVSKILSTLAIVRASLKLLFTLSPVLVEDSAWLVLNGCKLIALIGEPLIWHRCVQYVQYLFYSFYQFPGCFAVFFCISVLFPFLFICFRYLFL